MFVVSAVHFFHFVRDITKLEGMYTLASNTNITNALLQAISLFMWNHFVSVALHVLILVKLICLFLNQLILALKGNFGN